MKFWLYAVRNNVHLKTHLLGGAAIAAFAHVWLGEQHSLLVVFAAAILWEFIEYLPFLLFGDTGPYGDPGNGVTPREHFFMDAVGDVIGAMTMAALVLLN